MCDNSFDAEIPPRYSRLCNGVCGGSGFGIRVQGYAICTGFEKTVYDGKVRIVNK